MSYKILGVFDGLNASVCLIQDGVLSHALQEERITNVKNQAGMPVKSIEWIINQCEEPLDAVALSTRFIHSPRFFEDFSWMRRGSREKIINDLTWWWKKRYNPYYSQRTRTRIDNLRAILNINNVPSDVPIRVVDHHQAHAASAYYSSGFKNPIIVTADGSGDGLSASVSLVDDDGLVKRISSKTRDESIGEVYAVSTYILGFKPLEHEYKLMGMAPYAKQNDDITWGLYQLSHNKSTKFIYPELMKLYYGKRLDVVCASLQSWFEQEMLGWVESIHKSVQGDGSWCFAGGDYMNVKTNMLIQNLPYVKRAFFMPSASDESTCIGAAQQVYAELCREHGEEVNLAPLESLYLGPEPQPPEDTGGFYIYKNRRADEEAAKLISEGYVVARCTGRMEFGARALGNRSIIADPRDMTVIDRLNKAIKMRDHWMPFSCSIMLEDSDKYLVNPREIYAPYMITCFDSTEEARKRIPAGMHRWDYTIRPQMVKKLWNPSYYSLISHFKDVSGVSAVLNTSLNLHGYPIVMDTDKLLWTLKNSGLTHTFIGDYEVIKK